MNFSFQFADFRFKAWLLLVLLMLLLPAVRTSGAVSVTPVSAGAQTAAQVSNIVSAMVGNKTVVYATAAAKGAIAPDFIGQVLLEDNNAFYRAYGTNPGQWESLSYSWNFPGTLRAGNLIPNYLEISAPLSGSMHLLTSMNVDNVLKIRSLSDDRHSVIQFEQSDYIGYAVAAAGVGNINTPYRNAYFFAVNSTNGVSTRVRIYHVWSGIEGPYAPGNAGDAYPRGFTLTNGNMVITRLLGDGLNAAYVGGYNWYEQASNHAVIFYTNGMAEFRTNVTVGANFTLTNNAHIISTNNGTALAISLGSGAYTGGTFASNVIGNDVAGKISITTATAPAAAGATICTVTFAKAYTTAPFVVISPAAPSSGSVSSPNAYVSSTTTGFSLLINATALIAATPYAWTYHVIQ